MSSLNKGRVVTKTLAALADIGEMTAMELAEYIGIGRYDAHAVLRRIAQRTQKGLKRVYIVRYVYDHDSSRKYPRAVYALGDKQNAARPKADQLKVKREHYQRTKKRATMNSVFNLAAHWRAA